MNQLLEEKAAPAIPRQETPLGEVSAGLEKVSAQDA